MNDDEYGRPYYSPYDNYHPPYSTYGPYDRPTTRPTLKPTKFPFLTLPPISPNISPGLAKRYTLLCYLYPACVQANECYQISGTNIFMTNPQFENFVLQNVAMDMVLSMTNVVGDVLAEMVTLLIAVE